MAFPTVSVLNSSASPVTVNTLPNAGQNAKVDSLGVVIASDDDIQAKLGIVTETAPASDTASSGLNGRLQRIAQRLTSLIAILPASLGIKTAANSLSITHASDDAVVAATGTIGDAAWSSGNGTAIALLKAIAGNAISTGDSGVEVHQPADVITFTPTLDTAAYSSGDVLFATAALTGVTRANDLRAKLDTLTVIDKAKQNAAITLLFYQTNVTSAAANAANALSDADQLSLMGTFDIAAADWKTWANNSTVCYSGAKTPGLLLEAASGSTIVYVVAITTTTPTFAVGDLVFKFGFLQS